VPMSMRIRADNGAVAARQFGEEGPRRWVKTGRQPLSGTLAIGATDAPSNRPCRAAASPMVEHRTIAAKAATALTEIYSGSN